MKMRLPLLLGLFFLLISFAEAEAQTYLLLRKTGSTRRYEFFVGDEFVYKVKGQEQFYKDRITGFADSTLVLENNILLVSQVHEVDIRNARTNRNEILRTGETLLPIVGVGLLAIDLFNYTVVDGQNFSLDRRITTTSASLVTTGFALRLFRRKKFKLHKPNFNAYILGL